MYLNDLQTRVYFQQERVLDRNLEKWRMAHERKATVVSRALRPKRIPARRR